MTLRARDLLSPDVLRVPAESRASDYQNELKTKPNFVLAVFENDAFLGVVDHTTALRFPYRIFADLCHDTSSPPIRDALLLPEILVELERRGTGVLPVAGDDGSFLGVVSRSGITSVLLSEMRERLDRFEPLLETATELSSALSLEKILQRIVNWATRLAGAQYGALGVLDDQGRISRFFISGVDEATQKAIGQPPESMALLGELLREGKTLRLGNLAQHPRFSSFPAHHPVMRSFLGVPIRYRDRIVGNLYLAEKQNAEEFSDEDQILLELFAAQAAVAVEYTRLYEEALRRRREAEQLARVARALTESLDVASVHERIVESLGLLFEDGAFTVWHLRPDGFLEAVASGGFARDLYASGHILPPGIGVSGRAVTEGRMVFSQDVLNDPEVILTDEIRRLGDFKSRAVLAMPFRVKGQIIGVLSIADRAGHVFSETEAALFQVFADHAAIAIENSRLYEEQRRRAEEQAGLLWLSKGLLAARDLQEVLDHAVGIAAEVFRVELSKILLPDEDGKTLRLAAGVGWNPGLVGAARVGVRRDSQAGYTLEMKAPVVVWELATESRFSGPPLLRDHGVVSGMSVPMLAGETSIGVMGAHSRSHRHFTPDEVRLFSLIANQTAVAIEKARLFEQTHRQREEAMALEEIGREIASSLDREEILQRIVDRTRELCKGDLTILASCDRRAGNATVVATSGARTDLLKTLSFAPGAGLGGGALKTGEPFMTEDFFHDPRRLRMRGEVAIEEGFVAVAVVPLRLKGTITGLLWVVNRNPRRFTIRDISLQTKLADQAALALENSRLYEELRQALKQVEESQQQVIQGERLRALGQMAAGVAHDFNNALATILGRAQLLLAETKDPELQRHLLPIERVALDGARTVKRIQEFARKRRARPFMPVELNRVVQEVLEITRSRWKDEAEARGIHYDLLVEANPIPKLSGDAAELREALTNILFNALDAMPEGGRITFRTGAGGDRVFCAVTDTGVGMTDEVKQRLFDPFFTTKEEKGTGLGLSMVYGIVTRHGGEIEVKSRLGEGSCFTLWFPVGSPPSEFLTKTSVERPSRSAKVLVIEDVEEVREVLRELLASGGHTVAAYETGTSGLGRLQEEPFDLVITDLGMPRVSGWEVARLAKLHRPETPVALITGWGDQIDPGEARQKGVDFLVSKPFTHEDVFSVVAQALDRRDLKPR